MKSTSNETKCRNNQFNINNNRSNTFEHNQDQSWPTSGADSQQPRTSGFSSNSHMRDRSHEETSVLYKKLSDVFPLKNDAIRKLLKEHPYAFDIRFFSNKLTNNNTWISSLCKSKFENYQIIYAYLFLTLISVKLIFLIFSCLHYYSKLAFMP